MASMTPRPLEWNDTAPVRIVRTRRIAATPDLVWKHIADHESWTEWFDSLKEVVPGDPAEGVGGTRRVVAGPLTVDEEFLAWEPGERFAFTVVSSSGPGMRSMNEDVRLTPAGDSATTVTYTMALDPVAGKVTGPLLKRALGKALEDALAKLATRIEG